MQISVPSVSTGSSWEEGESSGDIEKQMPLLEAVSDPPIVFRPLQVSDREKIQGLHEEWFPVSYKDEFYDDLVLQRMANSGEELFTCAAVYKEDGDDEHDEAIPADDTKERKSIWEQLNSTSTERIAACLVGSFVEVSQMSMETRELLIADSTLHTRMFYIMTLGTVTEFRHHGLATRLLQRVMDEVERDAQCGTLYLHVITFNVAAIRFYEKLGFYRVTEMKDYYRIDDQNHNCFVYAKYYHGNQGRKDYYYLLTSLVSSIWRKVTSPFALAAENASVASKNR